MTHDDKEEVAGYVEAALNKRLVGVLTWLIVAIIANAVTVGGGIVFAILDRQKIIAGQTDRWTGTMANAAEFERAVRNEGYHQVNIREIQKEHRP